jgi:hypothetical protein
MTASIFVSHVFEDSWACEVVRQWIDSGRLGPGVVYAGESKDLRSLGKEAVRAHLSPLIRGASTVLLLVGNDTHNHDWISYEVAHARSLRKELVAIRLPNTTGALPQEAGGYSLVAFEPNAVRTAMGR